MTRSVAATAGVDWLKKAINLGRGNPGAVFGGAALGVIAMVVAMIGAALVQWALTAALGTGTGMVLGVVVTTVVVLVVVSMLLVGFLRLLDAVESGRPARATGVFAGFGDLPTSLRVIGFTLLLTVLQYVVLALVLAVLARGALDWYLKMVIASPDTLDPSMLALPDGLGIATVLSIALGLVFYGAQAIGTGQIALRGRGVFAAVADGFAGAFRNVLALLVLLVAAIAAAIVAAILGAIVAMVVGMLAKFAGAWLILALGIPLYLAFMLAVWVVAFGVAYHLWRDVCGGAGDAQLPMEPVAVGA